MAERLFGLAIGLFVGWYLINHGIQIGNQNFVQEARARLYDSPEIIINDNIPLLKNYQSLTPLNLEWLMSNFTWSENQVYRVFINQTCSDGITRTNGEELLGYWKPHEITLCKINHQTSEEFMFTICHELRHAYEYKKYGDDIEYSTTHFFEDSKGRELTWNEPKCFKQNEEV